jgi:putative FmdB family regulatory protein
MPKFDYQCRKCGHVFEKEHHIGENPKVKCPVCRGRSKKLISSVGIVFKGSGFYCTDNRKSGGNGSAPKGETVEVGKNGKKDTGKVASDKVDTAPKDTEKKKSSDDD